MRCLVPVLVLASACANTPSSAEMPWTAMIGIENQVFDPGPLPGGRDAWLATTPRLVVESFGKIAVPFTADPASATGLRLSGFFDELTGGSMFLRTEVATEDAAAMNGLGYGALLRVTIAQDGGTPAALLGAQAVLVYASIPGDGPCATGAVAHASEIDYRLTAQNGGASLGEYVSTDQTLRVGPIAIRFVVPDEYCARPH